MPPDKPLILIMPIAIYYQVVATTIRKYSHKRIRNFYIFIHKIREIQKIIDTQRPH